MQYPTACSPQAWSTGAPLLLLRTMLGLEPVGDHLIVDPALPEGIGRLELLDIPGRWGRVDAFGRGRVDVEKRPRGRAQLGVVDPDEGRPVTGDLFLGLDVGSSSTKAVLVDADGAMVADARLEHEISRPRPGWAEQDAERDWWGDVVEACRRLLDGRAARVRAVGVSALGPCVLPAGEDGRPLRPAILYGIDSRASAQVERLTTEFGAAEILARCGSRLSSQSAGPKFRWLADDEPEVWAATARVYGASSFIVSRLTGEYVLDHHSASHWAPLYDVYRNAWIEEWQDRVAPGIPLPRLVWPQERCGSVSRVAAAATGLPEGIPVAGGSIDSWCEVVASGLRGPGEGLLVYGDEHVPRSRSTARLAPTRACGRPSASRRGRRTSPPASPPQAHSRPGCAT